MIQAYYRAGNAAGAADSPHFHADYEILYVCQGWAEISVSGQSFRAEAPALVFFGNLEMHRVTGASPDYQRYVLTIPPRRLWGAPPVLLSICRSRPAGFRHALFLAGSGFSPEPLFQALAQESARGDEYAQFCAESLVRLLLAQLFRVCPQAFPAAGRKYPEGVVQAQRWLDEHCCQPLAMDAVARRFCMSASYFRHQFQQLIGLSPKQYVMFSRLARARELLAGTALPIAEIAEQCGFPDASNFSRAFRRRYGVSPSSLRATPGENNE